MPSLTLQVLAERIEGWIEGDPHLSISGITELAEAQPGDLAPFFDSSREGELAQCQASALLVNRYRKGIDLAQLICPDPRRAIGILIDLFSVTPSSTRSGIDPQAVVDDTARVDGSAWVGPFTYIGPGASIGPRSQIEPFTYVGPEVEIGVECCVGPGATLLPGSLLGNRVVLGPGSVVGQDGFGFWRDPKGWRAIRSQGRVELADDVEIGANSCIDRATLGATRVGQGAKIDNLVQVGHNTQIKQRALLCAQVGLAGSVKLGEDCVLGGQVGVADHCTVGDGGRVGGRSGVARDIPPGAVFSGYPALDHQRWLRCSVLISKLPALFAQVRDLSRQIGRLRTDAKED